jgi:hypothetical protein
MALIVEDGTGLADAETWASRSELIAFALLRGVTIEDAEASDVFLVKAMDYLRCKVYRGAPVSVEQGTPFPRLAYRDDDPNNSLLFPSDTVPAKLKRAQLLLSVAAAEGATLQVVASAGQLLKRRKVGPMEREYEEGSFDSEAVVPGVADLLYPYLSNPGIGMLSVVR